MDKKRRIASIVPNFNQAYFLMPHLEMLEKYVDKIIVVQGKVWDNVPKEHSAKPDNSIEMLKKYFPHIQVINDRTTEFCADMYNQGLELLEDYDIVTRFDTDMFMTEKDAKKFFDFIRTTEYLCYNVRFRTGTVNYYRDYDHGAFDGQEEDPIAVSPKFKFSGLLEYPYRGDSNKRFIIDKWDDFIIHHFRLIKDNPIIEEWFQGGLPYPFTETIEQVRERYTLNGEWIKAPEEIKILINKWKNKI